MSSLLKLVTRHEVPFKDTISVYTFEDLDLPIVRKMSDFTYTITFLRCNVVEVDEDGCFPPKNYMSKGIYDDITSALEEVNEPYATPQFKLPDPVLPELPALGSGPYDTILAEPIETVFIISENAYTADLIFDVAHYEASRYSLITAYVERIVERIVERKRKFNEEE